MMTDGGWYAKSSAFGSHRPATLKAAARTSRSHPLEVTCISVCANGGRIGITFCPGKQGPSVFGPSWDRDLTADIEVIRAWGASSVLTLLEAHEFDLLNVRGLPAAVRDAGMIWHHAPTPDVSVPGRAFDAAWRTIGPRLVAQLRHGQSVLVHCRGGLGRAGMVAAVLVIIMGEDPRRAIERVRAVRPDAIETAAQEAYVLTHRR
ncbi:cyclin-dependent kinase inhibitor 3 family protein [Methylobacterium sp. C33D]